MMVKSIGHGHDVTILKLSLLNHVEQYLLLRMTCHVGANCMSNNVRDQIITLNTSFLEGERQSCERIVEGKLD